MQIMDLFEADHAYDDPKYGSEFAPLKAGDRFRVFHGFKSLSDATSVAKYGLSGAEHADRVYSYEADNNPKGLFVTISFKVASGFTSAYPQIVMEFVADYSELEAPVWPGGSYTVQGQMAQYFGRGAKGRANRRQQAIAANKGVEDELAGRDDLQHVKDSDDKYLAYMLTNSTEHQALFVGHLDPNRIAAYYVREYTGHEWKRMSPQEFLTNYASGVKLSYDQDNKSRIFSPGEPFNGEVFLDRMGKRFTSRENVENVFRSNWADVMKSPDKARTFVMLFGDFLWPKQYIDAMRWAKSRYA